MAKLYLTVGLPGSGKTTRAKEIEKAENALRFSPDEWQIKLFGQDYGYTYEGETEHHLRHTKIEEIMWETAKRALSLGTNVVVDFGLWAKEERDYFKAEAKKLGAEVELVFMDVPLEELKRRVRERNTTDELSFHFDENHLDEWSKTFQKPDENELKAP